MATRNASSRTSTRAGRASGSSTRAASKRTARGTEARSGKTARATSKRTARATEARSSKAARAAPRRTSASAAAGAPEPVTLRGGTRTRLKRLAAGQSDAKRRPELATRARIILALASDSERGAGARAAREHDVSPAIVSRTRRAFAENGVEGLYAGRYGRAPQGQSAR